MHEVWFSISCKSWKIMHYLGWWHGVRGLFSITMSLYSLSVWRTRRVFDDGVPPLLQEKREQMILSFLALFSLFSSVIDHHHPQPTQLATILVTEVDKDAAPIICPIGGQCRTILVGVGSSMSVRLQPYLWCSHHINIIVIIRKMVIWCMQRMKSVSQGRL